MVLGWTLLITEMSTRYIPGEKCGQCVCLTTLSKSASRIFRNYGSLKVSQLYRSRRPIGGIANKLEILLVATDHFKKSSGKEDISGSNNFVTASVV
jgi:hypothetical protein